MNMDTEEGVLVFKMNLLRLPGPNAPSRLSVGGWWVKSQPGFQRHHGNAWTIN